MANFQTKRSLRYLSLAPAVIFLALLSAEPLGNLVLMSFAKVTWAEGSASWVWIGLDNYRQLLGDELFKAGILNTLILVVAATTFQVGLGLFLALICSQLGRASQVFRTLFLLPILIPGIIIGAIWKLMYNYQFGIINQILSSLGLGTFDWLGSSNLALASVIGVDVWHWTPFSFLLLLAAVEALPRDIFEAAQIDGAGAWRTMRRITLPLLWPAIFTTFVFRAIIAFKVFDEVYLLTGGGPGTSTQVISFTIYQRFFVQDNPGYGSAMSVTVIFFVTLIIGVAMTRQKAQTA